MQNLISLLYLGTTLLTSTLWGQIDDAAIARRTDSLMTDAAKKGIFSGVIIISHDGKDIYHKKSGYADWKTQRAVDDGTLFNIGSLNKQFTEELIHQLVKEKNLWYDAPLSKYLDLFPPETGDKITIRQLLNMRAGLGDFLQDPRFRKIESSDFTLAQLADIIKDEPLLFEPGTSQKYSNSGYAVLGRVIEKVTGKSYEKNIEERIARPLGLKDLYYTKEEKMRQGRRAYGTSIEYDGRKKSIDDISNSSPAGGIYTTASDLLAFTQAKLRNSLPSGNAYGNGMFGGGTPFWNAAIYYNKKDGYTFVILANMGEIADEISRRIVAIIGGDDFPPLDSPFIVKLYSLINEKGYDYIKSHAAAIASQAHRPYDDRFLNFFGYQFLEADKTDIAVALFTINAELFPGVPNTYDSLAEAYLKAGDKKNAASCYKKELELDPNNSRVRQALSDLGAQ
jgi:CubicO group peptidase (beta-lactamase class C family)